MADYLAGFVPDFVEKEEPREIILKLGKMITNRIPVKLGMQKLTKYDPEYWGLSLLLTDEMAEIALKMGVRKPRTFDELLKLTGKDPQTLEKLLSNELMTNDDAKRSLLDRLRARIAKAGNYEKK